MSVNQADRSEDELIARIDRKIAEVAFSRLLGDAQLWARGHHLPPDYRFNREEVCQYDRSIV